MPKTKSGTRPVPPPPTPLLIASLLILTVLIIDTILLSRISNTLEDIKDDLNNQLPDGNQTGEVTKSGRGSSIVL